MRAAGIATQRTAYRFIANGEPSAPRGCTVATKSVGPPRTAHEEFFISLSVSDLQKEETRRNTKRQVSVYAENNCSNFASEKGSLSPAKGSQARPLGRDKPLFVATDALSRRLEEG